MNEPIDPYEGCVVRRALTEGMEAVVMPLTFARGRICTRKVGDLGFDDSW